MLNRLFLFLVISTSIVLAQRGDRAGEVQKLLVSPEIIPPAPALSAEEALKSFTVAPGFRVEIVAADPLIHDPVAMAFDPDGRIYAVEMLGFMPNPDGKGEDRPVGQVVLLEDTTGDGRMDKRTVFLDGLVMPRALALAHGGVLVAEPPFLWFCRDLDGDGEADEKIEVARDYGDQRNPEHTANGLLWALDNWIYSANHTVRFRNLAGTWERQPTIFRGQWGITQDDYGRLYYNGNSDQLRGDFVPAHYLGRNPNYRGAAGANVQIARDQTVWPIRVTPGINRGYQQGMLRDGRLARFTAASGPVIYRGDQFPPEFRGNGFVPEPSANLIRRNIVTDENGVLSARNAYDKSEFLASTDERFRPVNLYNGPDGALYIVDFYRGILQHRIYLTTYLRQQIESRGLDKPLGLGRIYRVVHESSPPGPRPRLSKASAAELVGHLSHSNGWWRDTSQRLLIERGDHSVVGNLRQLARSGSEHLGRLHALYTLDGMRALDPDTVLAALKDSHVKVQVAAVRLSKNFFADEEAEEFIDALLSLVHQSAPELHWQLAFTFGQIRDERTEEAMAMIAQKHAGNALIRDALLSGLGGRELEFLQMLLASGDWASQKPGFNTFLSALSRCVFVEGRPARIDQVLQLAAAQPVSAAWRQLAILDGIASAAPPASKTKSAPRPKPVMFPAEPAGHIALARMNHSALNERLAKIAPLITWPGQPGYVPPPVVKPLTAEQQLRFEAGKELYVTSCMACHQPLGQGQEGLAPPLADSEWTIGSQERLVRIILQGVRGPIMVSGKIYDLDMPGMSVLDDEQIASILTYIRREWGHTASPVEPATVSKIRAATANRADAWTEEELLKIK
jgi:mono/diheme cytochrome c family protein/glucose/arabinose dehydrogenase